MDRGPRRPPPLVDEPKSSSANPSGDDGIELIVPLPQSNNSSSSGSQGQGVVSPTQRRKLWSSHTSLSAGSLDERKVDHSRGDGSGELHLTVAAALSAVRSSSANAAAGPMPSPMSPRRIPARLQHKYPSGTYSLPPSNSASSKPNPNNGSLKRHPVSLPTTPTVASAQTAASTSVLPGSFKPTNRTQPQLLIDPARSITATPSTNAQNPNSAVDPDSHALDSDSMSTIHIHVEPLTPTSVPKSASPRPIPALPATTKTVTSSTVGHGDTLLTATSRNHRLASIVTASDQLRGANNKTPDSTGNGPVALSPPIHRNMSIISKPTQEHTTLVDKANSFDNDANIHVSPWTLRFVEVRRKTKQEGEIADKSSSTSPTASSSTDTPRARALEHQYLMTYFQENLRAIQSAMVFSIVVWLLFIINDAYKNADGLRRNFAAIIVLRVLDSIVGLILVGLFQTAIFNRPNMDMTYHPEEWNTRSWREFFLVRKKYAIKYVEELMFFVLYLFGLSQILFGLWQNDSFDPTYSLIIVLLPSTCSTFFRQRYLFTLIYSQLLLITFIISTGASLNDINTSSANADADLPPDHPSNSSTDHTEYHFFETIVGLGSSIIIFTYFSYRKERLLRKDFLAGIRLANEERKSVYLLAKMLPMSIIGKLKLGDEFIYDHYPSISILFSHISGFDIICAVLHPIDLISLLNSLFSRFDALTDEHKVYKVETVGDCYLVASGCPTEYARTDHTAILAVMALDMRALVQIDFQMAELLEADENLTLGLQIGLHSGSIIAGVVGVSYPRFRLMGDTINTASRMSTTCKKGDIQLTASAYERLPGGYFTCTPRGQVQVKGKGLLSTYLLHSHKYGREMTRTQTQKNLIGDSERTLRRSIIRQNTNEHSMTRLMDHSTTRAETPSSAMLNPLPSTTNKSTKSLLSLPTVGSLPSSSSPTDKLDSGLSLSSSLPEMIKLKSFMIEHSDDAAPNPLLPPAAAAAVTAQWRPTSVNNTKNPHAVPERPTVSRLSSLPAALPSRRSISLAPGSAPLLDVIEEHRTRSATTIAPQKLTQPPANTATTPATTGNSGDVTINISLPDSEQQSHSQPISSPVSSSLNQTQLNPLALSIDTNTGGSTSEATSSAPKLFLSDGNVLLEDDALPPNVRLEEPIHLSSAVETPPINQLPSMARQFSTNQLDHDAKQQAQKVNQFTRDLADAKAQVSEDDHVVVTANNASKKPLQSFGKFFSVPVNELLYPHYETRNVYQRLTHSFLPNHPDLEVEFHTFFRARFLSLNRRAIWALIVVIFALGFYEQVYDLETSHATAQGVWACHFIAFCFGVGWYWLSNHYEEWYAKNLDWVTLIILSIQIIMFMTICLFYDTLGTAYGTGMCLLFLSVISMFSSMNFVYALLSSWILLVYYLVASYAWYGTVPGIILMLLAGCLFYVRSAYDNSFSLREIFLRKRNQIAETNLSCQLLDNMLPSHILNLMRISEFIALAHVESDILFSDIVGFTALTSQTAPIDIVAILNVMFSSFDKEALKNDVYKVETIGDAYLACCGVVTHPKEHTYNLVQCGLGFQRITQRMRVGDDKHTLLIRVGIHTGPVISGVIGKKMPRYHLFGETVGIAEEMEQKGVPGRVCISETTRASLVKANCIDQFNLESLPPIAVHVHANDQSSDPHGSSPAMIGHGGGGGGGGGHRGEKIEISMPRYLISKREKVASLLLSPDKLEHNASKLKLSQQP